ncbi:hypothetical protein NP493_1492g00005 [Ridgeia piscesae]|uniref:Dynactin subunit 3 n=1 Tax=Ridgeia piscesae TaxID=27915 RepID=A0AAD9K176_RIDPI|nr:hypothetical protein NP493_1492g00005 [Ridgeia piscesae]
MAATGLDLVEKRLENIEKRVFGLADKDNVYPKVIDTLAGVNQKLNAAVKGRPKIENVMRKVDVLNKLVDSEYEDEITQSVDTKMELILTEEGRLRQEATELELVKELSHLLSSEHVRAVPSMENQLQSLCKLHITQQDKTAELSDGLEGVFSHYNSAIALLSKQFVLWDKLVTELEMAAQPKKGLD